VVIFAGTNGYLDSIPVNRVGEYEAELLSYLRTQKADLLAEIRDTKDLGNDTKAKVVEALTAFGKQFA